MLKIGIIGAGAIGNAHVQAWQGVKEAKLIVISDISLERAW